MRAKGCWVLVTVTLAMGVAGLAHPAEERRTDQEAINAVLSRSSTRFERLFC